MGRAVRRLIAHLRSSETQAGRHRTRCCPPRSAAVALDEEGGSEASPTWRIAGTRACLPNQLTGHRRWMSRAAVQTLRWGTPSVRFVNPGRYGDLGAPAASTFAS